MNKDEIEKLVKDRAVRLGFAPDQEWAWHQKVTAEGYKPSLKDHMNYILDEARRRGWLSEETLGPAALDYEAHYPLWADEISFPKRNAECYWEDFFTPVFGSSEGIYLDWDGINYEDSVGVEKEHKRQRVSCFKTLDTSLEAMERIGQLAGRLTWLSHNVY